MAYIGSNCFQDSVLIGQIGPITLDDCKNECETDGACEFIIVDANPSSDGRGSCWLRHSQLNNDFSNCVQSDDYNTHVLQYNWDMKSTFCDDPQFTTHWSIYANYFDGELLNTYPQVTSDDIKTTCVDPCGIDPVCHSVTVNEDTNNLYNCQSWRIQESNVSESVHVYHGSSFGLFYKNPFTFIKKEFM